ncbi:MOSC domain-containing protein [Anoxybacteroides tepidamans]|uniref:MOSC domain-containing protein n=1 Tax=Anoxybacteroides tepidamans TaxID=265948 RepID=UPI0004867791|nr:MOSC domain-containing protein [Anoxybacillus tepidamans]
MKVVSVNVGMPTTIMIDGKSITTGIYKQPIDSSVAITKQNLAGDGQADLIHHGGPDKAICAYPSEHFAVWERLYQRSFIPGSFGENLTLFGLTEIEACIGDIFEVGTAVIQLSQPRQPCFKLAKRHGLKDLPLKVQQMGYTGFYFRVLQEGYVQQGDRLTLVGRSSHPLSVRYVNDIYYIDKTNVAAMKEIVAEPALSTDWRHSFMKRIEALEPFSPKQQ